MTVVFSLLGWLLYTKKDPINPFFDDSVISPIMGGIFILGAVLSASILIFYTAKEISAKKKENSGKGTLTAVGTVLWDTFASNDQRGAKTPSIVG
ncbi:MAG: hypothetical protein PG981_000270 [Wolbachia endosymbiont of Ctenocephalides orientis wCori]|nr:MAG: hypothetical protein PG981_000270 [Wolbachia endosymbiont of Ctenocephalides orientis wCori]